MVELHASLVPIGEDNNFAMFANVVLFLPRLSVAVVDDVVVL